jgi:uncharacterized protein YbaP (TraB family)
MEKRIWSLAVIILFAGHSSFAHPKSSLLWEITGNGLKKPSYLYGTVHSFDERAFRFAKLAESSITKCDAFGMEINLDNLGDDINIFSMMKYLTMPGDTTLDMLMSHEQYAMLDKFVTDSMHLALAMFNTIKPMFLMGMQEGMSMSEDSSDFLDQYFMKKAREHHKEIIGIETVEEQIKALDLIPLKEQARMVLEMIEPDTTKQQNSDEDLVDIYAKGDLDAIYAFYKKEDLSNTFNAALITDRNHRMADRIDSIMQKKSLFTAVGALHLPGDEGVISLLRKKGYTLTPVWKKD